MARFDWWSWFWSLIQRLARKTQFCVSFIALWPQNGSFPTPQSCQFINRPLFRSSPMVMKLNWVMTERVISRVQVAKMGFLRRVHSMTLRDKVRRCETHKSLSLETLSILISQLPWFGHGTRMPQGRSPKRVLLATATWRRPRSRPKTSGVATSLTCLGPVLVAEPAEQRLLKSAGYFKSS